ncbi:dihydrofolate reductase family protein [Actinopolymorpha pittospori]|nr:dihydrofolate reductase family protein [Actinopolymorpha pittospori]
MGIVRCDVTVSLDGCMAAPGQSLENPMGEGGMRTMAWAGSAPDASPFTGTPNLTGAFVMGRNMFGPGGGEWDLSWRGWWGEEPPYHAPVYVLSHYAREPLPMKGGTTFHFVTDGIEAALEQARKAADAGDVQIAGGASTVRQYLRAGLLEELVLHVAPVTVGGGERPLDDVGALDFDLVDVASGPAVTHLKYRPTR